MGSRSLYQRPVFAPVPLVPSLELYIYTDGGSRGNPGPSAAAWTIQNSRGDFLMLAGHYLPSATNNLAEYSAIIGALTDALCYPEAHVTLFTDSQLVVHQLHQQCQTRSPQLRTYANHARSLMARFQHIQVLHITRAENTLADSLVNQILDDQQPSSAPAPDLRPPHQAS